MKCSSFFVFHFNEEIEKRITQEPVRGKPPEDFRCAMVTWTPRIRCLKTADVF